MMSAPDYDAIEALGALAREETFRPGWPYQGSGEWTDNVIGMLGGHTGNFAGAMSPDAVDALIARCRELEAKVAGIQAHRYYCTGVTEYDCICGEPCGTRERWNTHFVDATGTALDPDAILDSTGDPTP